MGNTTAELKTRWPHGPKFLEEMRERIGPKCVVAFSTGKDAVAMTIALKPYFEELIPFIGIYVPGLRIMDEAIDYYETEVFGRKIIRFPHPAFISWMAELRFQTPESAKRVVSANLPKTLTFEGIVAQIQRASGIEPGAMYAVGSRCGEFLYRTQQVAKSGGMQPQMKQWWPIWDKSRQDVLDTIEGAGLRLSREYDMFHMSFCGIDYGIVSQFRKHEPDDYDTLVSWFPLIGAETLRYERHMREAKT